MNWMIRRTDAVMVVPVERPERDAVARDERPAAPAICSS